MVCWGYRRNISTDSQDHLKENYTKMNPYKFFHYYLDIHKSHIEKRKKQKTRRNSGKMGNLLLAVMASYVFIFKAGVPNFGNFKMCVPQLPVWLTGQF